MKNQSILICSSVAAIAAGILAGPYLARAQNSAPSPHVVSLVARQTTESYRPSGELDRMRETAIGIRSDGSRVDIYRGLAFDQTNFVDHKTVWDATNKKRIVANPLVRAITTTSLGSVQVTQKLAATGDVTCGLGRNSERVSVLGHEAIHSKQPRGDLEMIERWRVPSLGCFEIKAIGTMLDVKGNTARTVIDTVALELREPPAEMFALPNWPEMTQEQVQSEVASRVSRIPSAAK